MLPDDDLDGDIGTLDVVAMDQVPAAFTGLDGLIEAAGFQNLADPEMAHVYFSDGIGEATDYRLDIRWYRRGHYSVRHTDSIDRNYRWDYHPKEGAPDKHFPRPPDARSGDFEPSCITADQPDVVARIVHKLWRRAYDTRGTPVLNTAAGDL